MDKPDWLPDLERLSQARHPHHKHPRRHSCKAQDCRWLPSRNPSGQGGNAASPNFVHSLDAAHLIRVVNRANAEGITNLLTVHDLYACLAPQAVRLGEIIRGELAELYATDHLYWLHQRVTCAARHPAAAWMGGLEPDQVIDGQILIWVLNRRDSMALNTGRLDRIISELERLHDDADKIIDAHVNCLLRDLPPAASFGVTKYRVLEPAGRSLHYINALKLVRSPNYRALETRTPVGRPSRAKSKEVAGAV